MSAVSHIRLGTFDLKDFKMTSKTKDWSDTVQVDDVDQSSGGTGSSQYDVASLLADAPLDSIRQKINVERDEQVVQGPLPANEEALLNTDVVSEKVDLDLIAGQVQVTVCVRCERTVPLYSVDSVYKKSSVIVTRRVHIDMDCTETRRQLYATLQRRQHDNSNSDSNRLRLSAKETFQLYKGFMGLVEANENARTNFFKPQPGSILSDDIEILKKPPSRPTLNGTSPSTRHTDQLSRDNDTASESSSFISSRMPFSRETVTKATMSPSSDLLDNHSSLTEERTSYSSRITSRPDYGTSFLNSETETNNNSMTSPYSTYSSRYSTASRGDDQLESRSDYPSTRMSAYEKYRSRSPYNVDDRITSSRTSSNYISSRSTLPDTNASADVSTRPTSRYERVMASRSRSPYRTDNGLSTKPFVTRTISLDGESDVASYNTVDYIAGSTTTKSASRYDSLGSENGSYTSGIMGSTRRASIGASSPDTDRYPRSTLPSRYSGLQHTTSNDIGGSTPSYESRFTSRVSGDDRGTTSDYLSSRISHIRSASSPFSTAAGEEEHNPYYTSRYGLLSSSRDNSTTDRSDSLNKYTTNDDYTGRNGTREQLYGASMNNHTSQSDVSPGTDESSASSTKTNLANSYSRRQRPECRLESDDITDSSNRRPEVAVESVLTSSKPLSMTEDDTWKPVADAIDAAITSLNHVTSTREMNTQSSESDRERTPRSQSSIISMTEKPESRWDVCNVARDSESSSQITQSVAVIDSVTPNLPPSASATRVRRSSTSSNSVQASANTGPVSKTSSTRPSTASTARRNSATTSNGATTTTTTGSNTTSRAVPSYALSTSSSSMKASASSGNTPKPPMSRTNSSPTLREVQVPGRPQQRTSTTSAGSSSPSKPPPRAGRGDSAVSGTSGTPTERRGSTLSSSRDGAPISTERRGSTSSASKDGTPFSPSTSHRTAAVSEHRRTRNSSGSLSESNRSTSSASVAAPEETPHPLRPVSASRTAPSTPSSGRRTPTAAPASVTAAASRVVSRATTVSGVTITGSGPPMTTSSRPPAAPIPSSVRPVNAVRPYRSRNSSTSLNN